MTFLQITICVFSTIIITRIWIKLNKKKTDGK